MQTLPFGLKYNFVHGKIKKKITFTIFVHLQVNGINLRRVTHEKAVMFLKHNQVVNLLIARKKEQPS